MRTSLFQSFFFCCLYLTFLAGCTPDSENPTYDQSTDEFSEDALEETDDYADDYYDYHTPGWKKGTLTIKLLIKQSGERKQIEEENVTNVSWKTQITAETEDPIMVAPDLRVTIDSNSSVNERRDFYDFKPFYFRDEAQYRTTGNIHHSSRAEYITPKANGAKRLLRTVEESGSVSNLSIGNMHPSLYGEGYTVQLSAKFDTTRLFGQITTPSIYGAAGTFDTETNESQLMELYLHPAPNSVSINNYPFWMEGAPQEHIDRQREYEIKTLEFLQKIQVGEGIALKNFGTGLASKLESDGLQLIYEYSGDKVPPFYARTEGFATEWGPTEVSITILLKVDENK